MMGHARVVGTGCLIALVVTAFAVPVGAAAVNKPSNPEAEKRLLEISKTWDSHDPATYDAATRSFESVRTQYPDTLEAELAYVELLRIRWVKGEQEAVLREYEGWLTTQPSPVAQGDILAYFGDYAARKGDTARAENLYRQAIGLAGKHIVAGMTAISLAKMCLRIPGREGEALALYEQTTRDFTGTPIEWICRREWARALGSYYGPTTPEAAQRASEVLASAATAAPGSFSLAHARYNLAEVLVTLWRPAEALGVLELAAADLDAYREQEWAPHCLMLLIDMHRSLQQWDAAIASAQRYIKLFPDKDVAWAWFAIGAAKAGKGPVDEALPEFDHAVTCYKPDDAKGGFLLFTIGATLLGMQRYDDAHAYLDQIKTNPSPSFRRWREQAEYLDGQVYYQSGDYNKAKWAFEWVISNSSSKSEVDGAQGILAKMEADRADR